MIDYSKVCMLRLITSSLLNRIPKILNSNLNSFACVTLLRTNGTNRPIHLSHTYTVDYKTPTNSHKVFRPTTVAVTKQNKHLEVDLSDENGQEIGKVRLAVADQMAKTKNLRLVIMNESTSPPKFRLLHGSDLVKLQMQVYLKYYIQENARFSTSCY